MRSSSTRARAGELAQRATSAAGLDLAAERAQERGHRRRRSPASRPRGAGPADAVAEHRSMRPKRAVARRSSGSIACAALPANSACARSPAKRERARPTPERRPQAEAAPPQRMARQRAAARADRRSARPTSATSGPISVAIGVAVGAERRRPSRRRSARAGRPCRRRAGARAGSPGGPTPGRAPRAAACAGTASASAERVDRRAHVVPEAGQRQLRRARPAADRGRRLEDHHRAAPPARARSPPRARSGPSRPRSRPTIPPCWDEAKPGRARLRGIRSRTTR